MTKIAINNINTLLEIERAILTNRNSASTEELITSVASSYQNLNDAEKENMYISTEAEKIFQSIAKILKLSEKEEHAVIAAQVEKDFNFRIQTLICALENHIQDPQKGQNSRTLKDIDNWYSVNQEVVEPFYANKKKKFPAILAQAFIVCWIEKKKCRLKKFAKKEKNLMAILEWDSHRNIEVELPKIILKWALFLIQQSKFVESAELAKKMVSYAEQAMDNTNREIIFSDDKEVRDLIHEITKFLAQKCEKASLSFKTAEKRQEMRKKTAHYYLNFLRTSDYIEAFDHLSFVNKHKGLPKEGMCNAFTTKAIIFYKTHRNSSESFIANLYETINNPTTHSMLIEEICLLQKHDVSSNDKPRNKGLPTVNELRKLSNKNNFIEILLDLGRSGLKHSLLIRVSRNTKKEIIAFHLLDSTIGEATFPNTKEGHATFEEMMGILSKAYTFAYGSLQYVILHKEQALMKSSALLFKSATFKELTKNSPTNVEAQTNSMLNYSF